MYVERVAGNSRRGLRVVRIAAAAVAFAFLAGCGLRLDDAELINRASTAADQDDYRAAMIDLKTVLKRSPRNAEARVALGRVYLELADPFTAEKELRRAIEYGVPKSQVLVPLGRALLGQQAFAELLAEVTVEEAASDEDRIEILLMHGDAELASRRPDDARQHYTDVLERRADHGLAYLGMAATFIATGEVEQAAQTIDRAIEVDPSLPAAWMARGTFRFSHRDPTAAEGDMERALELATASGNSGVQQAALTGLTDVYLLLNKPDAALGAARRLEALAPGSIAARYSAARVAFARGNLDSAVILLQGILSDAPEFRQAYFLLGAVSRVMGNLAQAEMYLSSAVASMPDNVEARRLLADVRMRQSKPREASETIAPLLESSQVDDDLLAAAGLVKLQVGEVNEGVELIERSVEANPGSVVRRMDLAAAYLAVGEAGKAARILEEVADSGADPDRFEVLTVMATQRKDGIAAALREGEELLSASPGNSRLRSVVAALYMSLGDTTAARAAYEQALRQDDASVAALLGLARIAAQDEKFDDARLQIRRALQIEPNNLLATLEMARLAAAEGDRAASVSWLEKARAGNPYAIAPRMLLASRYLAMERVEDARQVAQEALQIDPDNAGARNTLGVIHLVSGNPGAAEQMLSQAVRGAPDNAAYRYNHARARFAKGDSAAALEVLEDSYARHPEHVPTAAAVAMFRVRNDNVPGALAIAQDLQQRLPDSAAGYALLGDIQATRERFAAAAAAYDQALQVEETRKLAMRAYRMRVKSLHDDPYRPLVTYLEAKPRDMAAREFLAQVYHSDDLPDLAAREYGVLLKSDPDNAVALNNLALILSNRGDPQARQGAASAYELLPDNGAVADTYGWILLKAGQTDEAISTLRKAHTAMPQNAEIQYHYGAALVEGGMHEEARVILGKLIASNRTFASRTTAEELFEQIMDDN